MEISVRFFTILREVTGKKEKTIKFKTGETVTVNAIIERLAKEYGKNFTDYVFDRRTGEVKGFLQFLINGRSASTIRGLETKLADGDILAIIPPVGGG